MLLTSAQRSAEVRALQRALYFYLSFGVCISALCGLRFTDFRRVAFSCKQRFQFIAPDKAIKKRDLKCVFVFANVPDIHIIEVHTEQDLKAQRTRACVRIVLFA